MEDVDMNEKNINLVSFWNCEPIRDLTNEENVILRKIENRIEKKSEGCFVRPKTVYNPFEKKNISVRTFVHDIFNKEGVELSIKDVKIYNRCNETKCVNPTHFAQTTYKIGNRLQKIGWEHFGKPEQEIIRIFELHILLEKGKQDETTGCFLYTGYLDIMVMEFQETKDMHTDIGGNWKILKLR